jgi:hypothetical protein
MALGYIAAALGLLASLFSFFACAVDFAKPLPLLSSTVPTGVCLLLSWLGGLGLAVAFRQLTLPKIKSETVKSDWQAQDLKLVAEIKSDRENQLEAKIATLESALNKALKKKQ